MRRKTLKPVKKKKKKYRNPAGKPLKDYTQFFFLGYTQKFMNK